MRGQLVFVDPRRQGARRRRAKCDVEPYWLNAGWSYRVDGDERCAPVVAGAGAGRSRSVRPASGSDLVPV